MAALTILDDEQAAAEAAAERITTLAEQAIAVRDRVNLVLTGGSTPELLYRLLADASRPWRTRIDWSRVCLYWGDERHVPPDHKDSNYGMAKRSLVDHVPVPPAQVHRMRGEVPDVDEAAREYNALLPLSLDVVLLGLGEDAHIASIFPGSQLLALLDDDRTDMRVAGVFAPHLNASRITLTPPALLDGRAIVMLVSGAKKADAVHAALELPDDVQRYPAQMLRRAADQRRREDGRRQPQHQQHVVLGAARQRRPGRNLGDVANHAPVIHVHHQRRDHADRRDEEIPIANVAESERVVEKDVRDERRQPQQELHPRPLPGNGAPHRGDAAIGVEPSEEREA